MEIIKRGTNIDFVGKRKMALFFSLALIAITIASLVYKKGPNYGIDFAGGTQVIVKFSADPSISGLRSSLEEAQLGNLVVQDFGDGAGEYLIRVEKGSGETERLSLTIK